MALPVNVTREALRSQQLADWRFAARSRSSVFLSLTIEFQTGCLWSRSLNFTCVGDR